MGLGPKIDTAHLIGPIKEGIATDHEIFCEFSLYRIYVFSVRITFNHRVVKNIYMSSCQLSL